MAGSINKVILVGNLGADPEVRSTQDGRELVNLSLATSESWKDKNTGERREKTEWHRVVVFQQGLVNIAKQYLKKGSKIYLEGSLQTRKWQDSNGNDKYTTEVVLQGFNSNFTMLDNVGSGGGSAFAPASNSASTASNQDSNSSFPDQGSFSGNNSSVSKAAPAEKAAPAAAAAVDDFEDEIPF